MKDLIFHNIYTLCFYKCDNSAFNFFRKNIFSGFILEQHTTLRGLGALLSSERYFLLVDYDNLSKEDIELLRKNFNDAGKKNILFLSKKENIDLSETVYGKNDNEYKKIIQYIKALSQQEIYEGNYNNLQESVVYAGKIQNAILPSTDFLTDYFSDYFIFNKPRDIVSGDFYWTAKISDSIFVAVGDCTGHGVPGAFMSILGVTLLNEILLVDGHYETDVILNKLRDRIISSLSQTFKDSAVHDGMDIAFCSFRPEYDIMQFSGAFNPAIIIRDSQIMELKADRMPVGIYIKDDLEFSKEYFDLKSGDTIYMFSDGFSDQIGGSNSRKLRKKRFLDILQEINHLSMEKQKVHLETFMEEWIGSNEQMDDMLIMGLKI